MTRSEYQLLIETLMDNQPNTAATVRGIFSALADGATFTNEVKVMDVPQAYIAANFDATGLGTNEMLGYAICNGNNGTRNWSGRVPMQYSSVYPTLGAIGGSSTHVLALNEIPSHSHTTYVNSGGGGSINGAEDAVSSGTTIPTSSVGGGQAHNNMQPYIVTLYVMKL